jgi:outer membrane protein OmpA-like peptidoglycan-associated protein
MRTLMIALPAAALIAACGPTRNAALDDARTAYRSAADDPMIAREAPVELQEAHEALRRAEREWEDDGDDDETNHLAYLAARRTEIARETARAEAADSRVESLARHRAEVTIAARNREIDELRSAVRTDRGLVYTVGDVLFAFDGTDLKPGAYRELQELVDFLRRHPDREIVIEGHTDSVGSPEYNQRLSRARAESVARFLRENGVDPARVSTRGYGERRPVASNDNSGGRQLNRRVEVVIEDADVASQPRPRR